MKRIHVVAGVLGDAQGRVLLAQRGGTDALSGLWEFPGGKVEAGEDSERALVRELREELDLDVRSFEPLVRVPWQYPELHVDLEVFRVRVHAGTPRGCQGQALRWVAPGELAGVAMPPADRPVVAALRLPRRYLITPEPPVGETQAFLARFERLLAGGVRLAQLRAKTLPETALRELAVRCLAHARTHGAMILANGRPELCMELGLDGVHLPAAVARGLERRPLPADRWVGVSCHDAAELAQALAIDADFVTLGPVLETPSHPGAPALGWDAFEELLRDFPLPCYALGGVGPSNLRTARRCGAFGVAGIRAFWNDAGVLL